MKKISIGADIGGSHISTIAVDLDGAAILPATYSRYLVNSNGSDEEILSAWKLCLAETCSKSKEHPITGIGFAMPGPFDYDRGIAKFMGVQKFDSLYGIDIRQKMKTCPGLPENISVRFLNDATCFAIGEAWLGEAGNHERVMAITLGTGFGSAFMINGIPIETGDTVPLHGWVYHLPFGDSIADDHFSTRWFIRRYLENTRVKLSGVREIAEIHQTDPAARQIFNEFGKNLGIFLAPLIRNFQADCLVIGGNIANNYDFFKEPFHKELDHKKVRRLRVYVSAMAENAALAGSARLSDDIFYHEVSLAAFK